ncbi:TPA: CpaF family protein [Aeromonas dhakensis]|nr:CpaF family protein [Aeromonas dhakensis]
MIDDAFLFVHKRMVFYIESIDINQLSISDVHEKIQREMSAEILKNSISITDQQRSTLLELLRLEAFDYGGISYYLSKDKIGDIMFNGYDQCFVEVGGVMTPVPSFFYSSEHLMRKLRMMLNYSGRTIDTSNPIVDARLPSGVRINAIIEPICLNGISLSIRKQSVGNIDFNRYIQFGSCNDAMADILISLVSNKKNIVVSGGTGSGKTTLLRLLASHISPKDRVITIEDAAELSLNLSNLVSLETRVSNTSNTSKPITIQDLVIASLRMRPDRIIVGECRGGEAFQMLQAMNTGHDGSMTSLHANSPRDAILRIESMVLMSGMDMPIDKVKEVISGSIDIIIQISRLHNGKRVITSISQVMGIENNIVTMHDVAYYDEINDSFIVKGLS